MSMYSTQLGAKIRAARVPAAHAAAIQICPDRSSVLRYFTHDHEEVTVDISSWKKFVGKRGRGWGGDYIAQPAGRRGTGIRDMLIQEIRQGIAEGGDLRGPEPGSESRSVKQASASGEEIWSGADKARAKGRDMRVRTRGWLEYTEQLRRRKIGPCARALIEGADAVGYGYGYGYGCGGEVVPPSNHESLEGSVVHELHPSRGTD
ncbi:hypothetical protein C8R45DRAFT_943511 [Mycena sanguinolenta]|nr:hypothetical protein C8R45DRAFT_943511 [Mycena sanguinolenta]